MRPSLPVYAVALVALIAGAALPTIASAQEAPSAAAQPDESFARTHLRAAQNLIDVTRSGEPFDDILPELMAQTNSTFVRATPALAQEIEDTVNEVAIEMAAKRADLARTMQLIWARRFSEEELAELYAFFQSPVGKRFADQTPVISALTLGAAQQWQNLLASEMLEATRSRLRDKGLL